MCKLLNNFSMKLSMSRKRIGSTLSWHSRSWTHGTTIWGGLRDLEGPWELRESPPLPRPLSFLPPSPVPSSAFPIKVCILIVVVLIFKCLRQVFLAKFGVPWIRPCLPVYSCCLLLMMAEKCRVHRTWLKHCFSYVHSILALRHALLARLCPVIRFLLHLIVFL